MTLNGNRGFHAGDTDWEKPVEIIRMLTEVAQGRGNLLLNVGPDGEGRVPEASETVVREVGRWLKTNGEAVFDTDRFTLDPQRRDDHRGDWCHYGPFTASGNNLYLIAVTPPAEGSVGITGFECEVRAVEILGAEAVDFSQTGDRLRIDGDAVRNAGSVAPAVLRICCDRPPVIYKTGGMRIPRVPHPHYDPIQSDIQW